MRLNRRTDIQTGKQRCAADAAVDFNGLAQCARVSIIAASVLYVAGLLGQLHWLADLCANFLPHLAALTSGCILILVFARWQGWAVFGAMLLAAELLILAPYLVGDGMKVDAIGKVSKARILQFNASRRNPDWRAFFDWLRPRLDTIDVLVLLEITPSWAPVLNVLTKEFPAHLEVKRTDSYGIAVFSRLRDSALTLRPLGSTKLPAVELRALLGERPITLIAVHTHTPLGRIKSEGRNAQLQELSKWIADAPPGHKVLLGDLNLTPFSPWFRELLKAADLSDAQYGLGLLPTWAPGRLPTALGLPIDHTLVSSDLEVIYRDCTDRFGSDHCPVTTDLVGKP